MYIPASIILWSIFCLDLVISITIDHNTETLLNRFFKKHSQLVRTENVWDKEEIAQRRRDNEHNLPWSDYIMLGGQETFGRPAPYLDDGKVTYISRIIYINLFLDKTSRNYVLDFEYLI